MSSIDPITLSVVWGYLIAICEEMGLTLKRTAYSEAVREGNDFSPGFFDARGRLIAQGEYSPGHLGAMPFAVKHALNAYPAEELFPGDAIVLNDLYMGSGHLPDIFVISPVFYKARIVGYAANCAHHVDVGGAGPGSQAVEGVKDFYQEGIRLTPVKLYERESPKKDILRILKDNVRVPEKVEGDLKAQVNANIIGGRRFIELLERYGVEIVNRMIDEILNRSEEAIRMKIREFKKGRYTFEDYMDDYGRGTSPVKVCVTVEITGEDIVIDFTGTDPQTNSGMNAAINYTWAYSFFAVKCVTEPLIPQNEGCMRPVKLIAPEGSLVNPRPPAGGGARVILAHRIFESIVAALAGSIPDKVTAAGSEASNPSFGGLNMRTKKRFVYYDIHNGSAGARSNKDGVDALMTVFNPTNIPIEVQEQKNPILIERYGFIPDSGGAGRYRGGCAMVKEVRNLGEDVRLMNLGDRHRFPPYGLFEGKPGSKGIDILNPGLENETELHSKGEYDLKKGDLIRFQLSSGGGYGNPLEREIEDVLHDVIEGYVSIEGAHKDYGVILREKEGILMVDINETEALRKSLMKSYL
jgi:N-methylhydantoinase B